MIQYGLVQYIKEQMQKGYKTEAIRQAILMQGYSHFDTDDTINYVTGKPPVSPKRDVMPAKKLNPFQKIETIIFHPNQFFESIKDEKIGWTMIWIFASSFFTLTGLMIANLLLLSTKLPSELDSTRLAITIIVMVVASLIFSLMFLGGYLFYVLTVHLVAKVLGGKGKYPDTFNVLLYSGTPLLLIFVLSLPVLVIIYFLWPDFILNSLQTIQTENYASIGLGLGFFMLLFFITSIWCFVLIVKGMGKLHQKSAWWGLAVMVVDWIIISIIQTIVVFILVASLATAIAPLLAIAASQSAGITTPPPIV